MRSTVRRLPHPSRPGRRLRFEGDEQAAAPRHSVRQNRVATRRVSLPSFRVTMATTPQPATAEPTAIDARGAVTSQRSTVWLGSWDSSQGTTSVEVRLGRRVDEGFVLHLVVRIGRGDLHRLLFATDEAEVTALVKEIGTRLVAALPLPPLAWNGGNGSDRTAA